MIESVICPFCGKEIPISIEFQEGAAPYLRHEGAIISNEPYPSIKLCLTLRLKKLSKNYLRLVAEEKLARDLIYGPPPDKK